MLAQLETEELSGTLTLQKLWYYILPTMHTMQVLVAIVTTIGKVCVIIIYTHVYKMSSICLKCFC